MEGRHVMNAIPGHIASPNAIQSLCTKAGTLKRVHIIEVALRALRRRP